MRAEILSHLSPEYPWKDQLLWFPELDSTNTRLKILAREGAPHGTALIAGHQTGGRGRMGRTFLSPGGMGIYLSLLLRPNCHSTELMHLTCAAAVAMCNAVETAANFRPGIKWTNDLVYGQRKLGGILTELGLGPQGQAEYAIIGIGINCCQETADFAPEIRDMAGSLSMAAGKSVAPAVLAAAMLEELYRMEGSLLTGRDGLMELYRRNCVTLGKEISILRGDEIRHGKALDITSSGALTVEFSDGRREDVNSGEVSIRGMYGYL